uniref:Putative dual specificity protein phosphatase n=1 Tax=Lutzomyia longipalpis TaxID=7200 RepID=A0A1B0CKV1_LUTLO
MRYNTVGAEFALHGWDLTGWSLKGLCVGIMIILNALVWTFFVKALHSSRGGSTSATVVSSGTNYFASDLTGWSLKGLCVGIMIILNALVWTFFVKALHSSRGGSTSATVVSSGTNYFASKKENNDSKLFSI